jgi:stage II sporulation protein M
VCFFVVAAGGIGWAFVAKYPVPQGMLNLENLSLQELQSMPDVGFLPSLTTMSIWTHNIVTLLLAGVAAVLSLGVFAILMLMVPITLVGFISGQVAWLGYSALTFLAAFILPHGLFELPAAIVATAFALRMGASITSPRPHMTVGEGLILATADFVKVFLFCVVPLLLIAAFVEAHVTPQIVIWFYGG